MPGLERAISTFGWMPVSELQWLRQQASIHKNIVEIGSFMGRSTIALAENTRGQVTAVDTWAGSDEPEHKKMLEGKPEDWLFQEFLKNTTGLPNILAVRMKSLDAASYMGPQKFDMIFIDASHDYENVKADILTWRELLTPGGLLCGHDFHTGAPGVVQAVNELVPGARGYESIWFKVI
jgi:predicted O-methyltransferase YrrM